MSNVTELFRYEDDGDEDGSLSLYLRTMPVIKKTPCGVRVLLWGDVDSGHCKTRFVMSDACRPYAHSTKNAALESYLQRKKRQVRILETRLEYAQRYIELAIETQQNGGQP